MPTLKKARNKVTYRVVNRPRDDPEYHEGNATMWVSEEELHPNRHRATTNVHGQLTGAGTDSGSAGLTAEDLAYFAARGHGEGAGAPPSAGRRRVHFDDDQDMDDEEGMDEEGYYDEEDGEYYYFDDDEEDGDWLDDAEEVTDERALMSAKRSRPEGQSGIVVKGKDVFGGADGEVDEDDDGLFADEVECEVTDDFLRQLVLGTGLRDDGEDEEDEDDLFVNKGGEDQGEEQGEDALIEDAAAFDAMMEAEDGEMWRLLTEEERQAIRETHLRGTARRRRQRAAQAEGADVDVNSYPRHDVTRRALEKQFDAMLREFDGDEAVNDAYTDDPRTHGPLSMDKYLNALQEFVVDRAGVDLETAEPRKNKGLITQLKLMSHRAGAFDSDQKGGVFVTTLLPDKQNRFVAEYRNETEEIRRQARLRVFKTLLLGKLQAHAADAIVMSGEPDPAKIAEFEKLQAMLRKVEAEENTHYEVPDSVLVGDADVEKEVKELVEREIQKREGRMDCETAVSAHSTYFNQPNVIKAPTSKRTEAARRKRVAAAKARRNRGAPVESSATLNSDGEYDDNSGNERDGNDQDKQESAPTAVILERRPDETPEERKARRQAVKAAQRARRQEKGALKKAYKNVEQDELKRNAQSHNARRTVKFA